MNLLSLSANQVLTPNSYDIEQSERHKSAKPAQLAVPAPVIDVVVNDAPIKEGRLAALVAPANGMLPDPRSVTEKFRQSITPEQPLVGLSQLAAGTHVVAANRPAFDISTMKHNGILAFMSLLIQIEMDNLAANRRNQSSSLKLERSLAEQTASSIIKGGVAEMAGAVSQALFSGGLQAGGFAKKGGALKMERNNVTTKRQIQHTETKLNSAKLAGLKSDEATAHLVFDGKQRNAPMPGQSEADHRLKFENGRAVQLDHHQRNVAGHHATRLDDAAQRDLKLEHNELTLNHETTANKVQKRIMKADVLLQMAPLTGGIASAGGHQIQTIEKASQQLLQQNSHVASALTENSKSQAEQDSNMFEKMMAILKSVTDNHNEVVSSIAGRVC